MTTLLLLFSALLLRLSSPGSAIGVNYGTISDNLPPPAEVANFIKTKTTIDSIKIFDTNPDILRAFANTGIFVTVTVGNGDIPALAELGAAKQWVANHIKPFVPQTKINHIAVGNEILMSGNQAWISNLVPCMKTLNTALNQAGIRDIKISTPHTLGILYHSVPPSSARIRPGYQKSIFAPMLQFLRETKSPLMVNPYPYFSYAPKVAKYALFKPNRGIYDRYTKITYKNMFDAMMDAVFSAIKAMGYADVEIMIAETGWPSAGDPNQPACSVENAVAYNGNLIKHVTSGQGTPLMPNRRFETYIFALFNENLKPGTSAERNWGLFRPDFSPVYDVGIMRGQPGNTPKPNPNPNPNLNPRPKPNNPGPKAAKKWCVAKDGVTDQQLQSSLDWACSQGVDCKPVQAGGSCFEPNNIKSHASFAMNSYYQTHGKNDFNCDFSKTAVLTSADPSNGGCKFL